MSEDVYRRRLRASYEHFRPEIEGAIFVPDLEEDDVVDLGFSTFDARIRVIDSLYLDIELIGWQPLPGPVKLHGAISMHPRLYLPMAIMPNMGIRIGMAADPVGAPPRPEALEKGWIITSEVVRASVNDQEQFRLL